MTTPVQPSTKYTPRREIREWTDFDRLLLQPSDGSKGATISALLLTLLFHGALFLAIPWTSLKSEKAKVPPAPVYDLQPFTVEDMKLVEANPNAPQAKPQNTPNVSDRNQEAAQEQPDLLSQTNAPTIKGEQNEVEKIVSGDVRNLPASPPPSPASPVSRPTPPSPPHSATPPQPQMPPAPAAKPAPATEKPSNPPPTPQAVVQEKPTAPPPPAPDAWQGKPDTSGEGANLAEKPVESKAEKPADSKTTEPAPPTQEPAPALASVQEVQPSPQTPASPPTTAEAQPSDPSDPSPMPRREVQVRVPAGPLMNSMTSARSAGVVAIESNFSDFGNYETRMKEAICAQWYNMCDQFSFSMQDYGTRVVVVFTLNQQGEVTACQVVNSTASNGATLLCTQAVQSRSPFGPWTKEMCQILGTSQNVRIIFWYRS
ncbi:MAG: hypothetical protein ABSH19_09610 [Opitutales bacterium]